MQREWQAGSVERGERRAPSVVELPSDSASVAGTVPPTAPWSTAGSDGEPSRAACLMPWKMSVLSMKPANSYVRRLGHHLRQRHHRVVEVALALAPVLEHLLVGEQPEQLRPGARGEPVAA